MAQSDRLRPARPGAVLYGSWKNAFVGGSHEFLRDGARLLDARTQFHYLATVITPAMAHAQVGAGSAYAYTVHDANGDLLDGAKTYRLHVDPDPPAKNFWAVDVYDTQTRSLIQVASTIYPALASNSGTLQANDDGSYDLYFGPDGARRQGDQLGRDDPRQVVVPALPALRPAASRGSTRPGSSTSSSRSTERRRSPEHDEHRGHDERGQPARPRPPCRGGAARCRLDALNSAANCPADRYAPSCARCSA